ncbi:VPLPA-CTERM protein sorting domain-containing protein [Ruegeria halocynthiae]|uniref:VPLPA-CTERM protein sorting domain-containing protein n=1 Tax=Ruegeria halocynthiae TaxID=985054 RepID=A0A1H3E124_9RHOB|nr:VPLPA-CTERM sorting domain-containing protein [Ruegeria halocynthiae]SDX72412.1 VPLPA-CTERM protein sorting domain-containing protein [Ruegeria halocynthiae]
MLSRILAVASTVVLIATGAQAVTFNLTGAGGGDLSGTGSRTATFDEDGVSGRVRANSTYRGGRDSVITSDRHGIGVDNGRSHDSPDIDGANGSDWLTFTFDTAVRLVSISFGHFDAYDLGFDWRRGLYLVDDDDAWVNVRGDGAGFTGTDRSTYYFGDVIARGFSIRAFQRNDDFVVSSFTVAPIPLPASALLLIGGLAGFGVMRRRKQRMA